MESAPTGLKVVLKFVCRGGYYPPVYDNPSVIFFAKMPPPFTQGRRFLVLVLLFGVLFLVGRGRHLNVCEANFTLSEAKQFDRPSGDS